MKKETFDKIKEVWVRVLIIRPEINPFSDDYKEQRDARLVLSIKELKEHAEKEFGEKINY